MGPLAWRGEGYSGGTGIGTQLVWPSKMQSWSLARCVMLSAIHTPQKTMTESTAKASAMPFELARSATYETRLRSTA